MTTLVDTNVLLDIATFGQSGDTTAFGIAVDLEGNRYVVGTHTADLDLGGSTLPGPPPGATGAFVARLPPL